MLRILIPLAGVSNATSCLIASRTCWEPKMVVFHVLTPKYYAKLEIYQKWSMINCNLIGPSCDIFLLLQIDFKCKKRLKCCLITSRTRWESKWWIFILSHEKNNLMEIFFTIIVPHLAWLTPIISWHFGQHDRLYRPEKMSHCVRDEMRQQNDDFYPIQPKLQASEI